MKQTVFNENRYYEELEKGSQSTSEKVNRLHKLFIMMHIYASH